MRTLLKTALAGLAAVVFGGPAWAAECVAQWTDFGKAVSGPMTLNLNGNTYSPEVGYAEIGSAPLLIENLVPWDARATGTAFSLVMKVSNLTNDATLTSAQALLALSLHNAGGAIVPDRLGFQTIVGGGKLAGLWKDGSYTDRKNNNAIAAAFPADKGEYTLLFQYDNSGSSCWAWDGTAWTQYLNDTGLKGENYATTIALGGSSAGELPATGLRVHAVAVWKGALTEAERASAIAFPPISASTRERSLAAGDTALWQVPEDATDWGEAGVAAPTAEEEALLTLAGDATLTMNAPGSVRRLGVSGTGRLTFAGDGTEGHALTAAATVVNADVDATSGVASLGAAAIAEGKTLTVARGDAFSSLAGPGNVVFEAPTAATEITHAFADAFTGAVRVTKGNLVFSAGNNGTDYPKKASVTLSGADAKMTLKTAKDTTGYAAPAANKRLIVENGATLAVEKRDTFNMPLTLNGGKVTFAQDDQDASRSFDLFTNASITASGTSTIGGASATVDSETGDSIVNSGIISVRRSNLPITVEEGGTLKVYAAMGKTGEAGGSLVKAGAGTLEFLRAATSFSLPVAVNAGTLRLTNKGQASTGTITVAAGATLALNAAPRNAAYVQTVANALSGTGALVKSGAGATTLSGDLSAFTGPVTVEAGALDASAATFGAAKPAFALAAGGTLTLAAGTEGTLTVPEGATLRLRLSSAQRASWYEAKGVTLGGDGETAGRVVFLDEDDAEIAEGVSGTLYSALNVWAPNVPEAESGAYAWAEPGNWSQGRLPEAAEAVLARIGGDTVLKVAEAAAVGTLSLVGQGTLTATGEALSFGTLGVPEGATYAVGRLSGAGVGATTVRKTGAGTLKLAVAGAGAEVVAEGLTLEVEEGTLTTWLFADGVGGNYDPTLQNATLVFADGARFTSHGRLCLGEGVTFDVRGDLEFAAAAGVAPRQSVAADATLTLRVASGKTYTVRCLNGTGTLRKEGQGGLRLLVAGSADRVVAENLTLDIAEGSLKTYLNNGDPILKNVTARFAEGTSFASHGWLGLEGTVTLDVAEAATLTFDAAGGSVPAFNGAGKLRLTGAGTLRLTAAHHHTGGIEIAEGATLVAEVAGALGGSGAGAVTGAGTLRSTVGELANASRLALAETDWTGRFVFASDFAVRPLNLGLYGNADSEVEFAATYTGCFTENGTCAADLILSENGRLVLNAGFSGKGYTFAGELRGEGTIEARPNSSTVDPTDTLRFVGDASAFAGTVTLTANAGATGHCIAFGDAAGAASAAGKIVVAADRRIAIAAGKTWSATRGIVVRGTVGGAGTVGCDLEVLNGATLAVGDNTGENALEVTGAVRYDADTANLNIRMGGDYVAGDPVKILSAAGVSKPKPIPAIYAGEEKVTDAVLKAEGDALWLMRPTLPGELTLPEEEGRFLVELAAKLGLPVISGIQCQEGCSQEALALFEHATWLVPNATDTEGAVYVAYAFGIDRMTIRELPVEATAPEGGWAPYVVLRAKVLNTVYKDALTAYFPTTDVEVLLGGVPLEGVEPMAAGPDNEEPGPGERWFRIPYRPEDADSPFANLGLYKLTVRAVKRETPAAE